MFSAKRVASVRPGSGGCGFYPSLTPWAPGRAQDGRDRLRRLVPAAGFNPVALPVNGELFDSIPNPASPPHPSLRADNPEIQHSSHRKVFQQNKGNLR